MDEEHTNCHLLLLAEPKWSWRNVRDEAGNRITRERLTWPNYPEGEPATVTEVLQRRHLTGYNPRHFKLVPAEVGSFANRTSAHNFGKRVGRTETWMRRTMGCELYPSCPMDGQHESERHDPREEPAFLPPDQWPVRERWA